MENYFGMEWIKSWGKRLRITVDFLFKMLGIRINMRKKKINKKIKIKK